MDKKHLFEIEIQKNKIGSLRKTLRSVPGFKQIYAVTKSSDPEGLVTAEIQFNSISKDSKKYLENMIKRRGGKVVDSLAERKPRINAENRRLLRNSLIYFVLTFVPGFSGIAMISPSLGISLEFTNAVLLAIPPAVTAFFTRLAIELKI